MYVAAEGSSFRYPASWDRVEQSFAQHTGTGKTIAFESGPTTEAELEQRIASRIEGWEAVLHTTVFSDGSRGYAYHAAVPPVTEEEYALVVESFSVSR